MNPFSQVPPGFRFHPTDEELVDYYLRKKLTSQRIDPDVIKDVDLYKIEPWDFQELCRIGTDEQNEWHFFSHKDKKYPTGTRTNRATTAGFWKATGRDKEIYSKHELIGMRKTLVFYKGRAPNGQKSDWIMHEYRLKTDENRTPQEEGWVVCRLFKKKIATIRRLGEYDSPIWYDHDQVSFMSEMDSPRQNPDPNLTYHHHHYPYLKKVLDLPPYQSPHEHFIRLPLLQSPKLLQEPVSGSCNSLPIYVSNFSTSISHGSTLQSSQLNQEEQILQPYHHHHQDQQSKHWINNNCQQLQGKNDDHELTDWRVLDKFVASQLSQESVSKENDHYSSSDVPNVSHSSDNSNILTRQYLSNKQETTLEPENAFTSISVVNLICGNDQAMLKQYKSIY